MWVGEVGDSGRNKEFKLSYRRLRGFRGKREGKESRENIEVGIFWYMWELVGRLVRVLNLCWDMGN